MSQVLHHVTWLYHNGQYDAAVRQLQRLLHAERNHPGLVSAIHRFMYALNPDWGL